MAGLTWRGLRAATHASVRFALVEMRRRKHVLLLAAVLSGLGSAAFAAPAAGSRLPAAPAADPVALAERYENGESMRRDYREALTL